jgi:hypothetical protein
MQYLRAKLEVSGEREAGGVVSMRAPRFFYYSFDDPAVDVFERIATEG